MASSSTGKTPSGVALATHPSSHPVPSRPKSASGHRHAPYPHPAPQACTPLASSSATSISAPAHLTPASPPPSPATASASAGAAYRPYMVALSGWPEPVYVDSTLAARSSRPGTPRGSLGGGGLGDGIGGDLGGIPPLALAGAGTMGAGAGAGAGAAGESGGGASPRGGRGERGDSATFTAVPASTGPGPGAKYTRFADPRLAPHAAVMHNRGALRVAPGWYGSASASGQSSTRGGMTGGGGAVGGGMGVGVGGIPGGASNLRGTGLSGGGLVMRATPEVYPPPTGARTGHSRHASSSLAGASAHGSPRALSEAGSAAGASASASAMGDFTSGTGTLGPSTAPPQLRGGADEPHGYAALARLGLPGAGGMVGVATEVYPRDPESGITWRNPVLACPPILAEAGAGGSRGERGGDERTEGRDPFPNRNGRENGTAHHTVNETKTPATPGRAADAPRTGAFHFLAPDTPRGEAWSPNVPWAPSPRPGPHVGEARGSGGGKSSAHADALAEPDAREGSGQGREEGMEVDG